jgi:hypothetical protein
MLEKIYNKKNDPFCSLIWRGPKKDLFMLAEL